MAMMIPTSGGGDIFEQGTPIKLNVQQAVQHPFFPKLPRERVIVFEDSSIILECRVGGIPKSKIQWIRLDDELPLRRTTIKPSGRLIINRAETSDAGRYMCSATNVAGTIDFEFDVEVKRNPQVIRKTSKEGFPAVLDCNIDSSISTTNARFIWTKNGTVISPSAKTGISVLVDGKLYIKKCSRKDSGVYKCTARTLDLTGSSILSHPGQSVFLDVQFAPRFTTVPPSVKKVRIGKTIYLVCDAVSDKGLALQLTWIRVNRTLPLGRSEVNGGHLTITDIQRGDYGEYTCLASTREGTAKHSTTVTVISTPGVPNITMISRSGTKATISWIPGYDGGHIQTFELRYKKLSDTDSQWKFTPKLSSSTTTYTLSDLELGVKYLFSVRGMNSEGAGSSSEPVFYVDKKGPQPVPDLSGKPRPPTNVIVNITSDGYYVSWDHEPVAGRPLIKYFVLEYRKKNSFAVWTRADLMVNGDQRVYLFRADLFDPESDYDFRVYAYAKMFSEPAYVSKTNAIVPHVVSQHKPRNYVIPIVAGVLGSIIFVLLLCIAYVSFKLYNGRKKPEDKASKKIHFLRLDRKGQSKSADKRIYEDVSEI